MIRLQINNLTNIKIINMKKNTLVLFILFFSFTTFVVAQEAPTTSGGDATGSGGSVAFSIGQVVYVTNTGSTGTEAEGVQQPYEISVVTAIDLTNQINFQIELFPNPSADYVKLKIENLDLSGLRYELLNEAAQVIENNKIEDYEKNIAMNNLPPAVYFLKVYSGNKNLKIFKIIKN